MKKADVNNLTALGEGFTVEFKRSGTSSLGRELCAFANATGGVVLIGVTDTGDIVGVDDHNRLKAEVQAVARSAEPPIAVEIESVGKVLAVTVPAQHSKPYSFGGKFFIREGATSQQMSRSEIREFFYKEGLIHFDETPCSKFSLAKDLSDEVWALFRRRARIPAEMEPVGALTNLHLLDVEGRMSHAGAWLLSRDIRKFTVSADAACALFMGSDKVRILDRRGFHGDVYSMIDDVVAYILSKINVEYIIKHVKREERPELPEEALREAVVNALAHRDYRSTANVQVYIFKDRVEIVSPGGLPAGMTEADLGVKSIPRNPLLFALLHRMDAVENIGSGIKRIRKLCEEYGVDEPKIEVSEYCFTVTFPRPNVQPELASGAVTPPVTPPVTQPVTPPVAVVVLIRLIGSAGPLGNSEILANLGLSDRTHLREHYIDPALAEGLVERTIPDKPTSRLQKYRLTEKGHALLGQVGNEGGET